MGIGERIKSARQMLGEVRSEMGGLLQAAWQDECRTLNGSESEVYEALEETEKELTREIATLEADLAAQAATAKPPRSNADA